jgi:hypothetical protein
VASQFELKKHGKMYKKNRKKENKTRNAFDEKQIQKNERKNR